MRKSMLTAVGLTLGIVGGMAAAGNSEPNKPALSEKTLIVAPTGDDQNPGTEAKPLAGLAGARDRVRQWVAAGLRTNVQVLLRGGTYFLPETVVFDQRDSGTEVYSITYASYPGEKAVVSGGRRIAGWQPSGTGGLWRAEVSEVKTGWDPRELYVNGKRAVRARTPNPNAGSPLYQCVGPAKPSDDLKTWRLQLNANSGARLENWKNVAEIEVIVLKLCQVTRKQLLEVNPTDGTFLLKPPHPRPEFVTVPPWRGVVFCYFENGLEFLDQPGEWRLDRAGGALWYLARGGEDMGKAEAIAPALSRLIVVKGGAGQPVRNLHFEGLVFSHADWRLPPGGYLEKQASFHITGDCSNAPPGGREMDCWVRPEAALSFEYAVACGVENGEIARVGATGIEWRRGCAANVMQGNRVLEAGGNGIMVGETAAARAATNSPVPADAVIGNRIVNNLVRACGETYLSAVGIWVGVAEGTLVARNLVGELPSSGIVVGWERSETPTGCRSNLVLRNQVQDVARTLPDGAGIAAFGLQPGTALAGNVVQDVRRSGILTGFDAGNNGILGSSGLLIESNVVFNINGELIRCAGKNNTLRDNFASKKNMFEKGVVGCAMLFDDKNPQLDIPPNPALDATNLTVEAWVNPRSFPRGDDPCIWLANRNPPETADGHYALLISRGNVGAQINTGGGRVNFHEVWSSNAAVTTNVWNHFALTYDGRDLKVYCNGVLQKAAAINRPRAAGGGILRLGRCAEGQAPGLDGLLDEVRVYARALSAEELLAHCAKPAPADPKTETGLAGCWSFDEAQGALQRLLTEAGPEEPYRARLGL